MIAEESPLVFDYRFLVLLLGARGSGKSTYLAQLLKSGYDVKEKIGYEFAVAIKRIDSLTLTIVFRDPAPNRGQSINESVNGCCLFYDCTNRASFERAKSQLSTLQASAPFPVCLLAAKCDSADTPVSYEEGRTVANAAQIPFFDTSAVTGRNVNEAMEALIREMVRSTRMRAEQSLSSL